AAVNARYLTARHAIDTGYRQAIRRRCVRASGRIRRRGDRLAWRQRRKRAAAAGLDGDVQKPRGAVEATAAGAEIELDGEDPCAHRDIGERLCRSLLRAAAELIKELELKVVIAVGGRAGISELALICERRCLRRSGRTQKG